MNRKNTIQAVAASTLAAAVAMSFNAVGQTAPTIPDTAAKTVPPTTDTASKSTPNSKGVPSSPRANGSGLAKSDAKFIENAAKGGLAEVEMGKLAQQQAADPAVKDFGARMVKDHSAANDKLKPIADAKSITLPSSLDRSHRKDYDKLAKKSGADFDKAYMDHMLKDHKKDVKEFEKEAKSGKDADIKGFASDTLPTLEEHLRLAQQTHDAVKGKK